jgi:hypothetical protein
MAFSLIVIFAYQSYAGYVYEMIGLLTGTFMLGGAIGAHYARQMKSAFTWLRIFELILIMLMMPAIFFMNMEIIFYIFILAAGILGGSQFAAANLVLREKGLDKKAGRLYAVDLAGSFLGSFVTAILMVPLIGMQNTILFLIFIKTVSLIILLRYKHQ